MTGKVRYLLNRDGRYFDLLTIPKKLRQYFDGKSELRTALGPDYRSAIRLPPSAVQRLVDREIRERMGTTAMGTAT